jgi:hypothetical protein
MSYPGVLAFEMCFWSFPFYWQNGTSLRMATGFSAAPRERSTCLARPLNQIVAGHSTTGWSGSVVGALP